MTDDASDLFGHGPAQGDLFGGEGAAASPAPQVDTARVRRRLLAMLAEARAARKGSP